MSEVQFQSQLHLTRRVSLVARSLAKYSESLRLQSERAKTEADAVEHVEHLGPEVDAGLFLDPE